MIFVRVFATMSDEKLRSTYSVNEKNVIANLYEIS